MAKLRQIDRHKSPFVADVGVAFGAQMIVVLAIIFAIVFSSGAIADFLNRISGN